MEHAKQYHGVFGSGAGRQVHLPALPKPDERSDPGDPCDRESAHGLALFDS